MYVQEFWKGGYKYFIIDLGDGEARMCLSPCEANNIHFESYNAEIYPRGKIYYVDFIKVSPSYRNLGFGSKLLNAAIEWAKISKNVLILDAIPLDTGIEQQRLVNFYIGHGFTLSNFRGNKYSMIYHDRKRPRKKPNRT